MHLRSTTALSGLLAVLVLTGCGGEDNASATAATPEATPRAATTDVTTSPSAGSERIPDGRYGRVVTDADFDASGLPEELRQELLGKDGALVTAFEFDGDRFTHYVTNDAGVEEVGDLGTLEYDDEGRLAMTSESTGCPGCVGMMAWTLEGDALQLELQNDDVDPVDAFVLDGVYTREG